MYIVVLWRTEQGVFHLSIFIYRKYIEIRTTLKRFLSRVESVANLKTEASLYNNLLKASCAICFRQVIELWINWGSTIERNSKAEFCCFRTNFLDNNITRASTPLFFFTTINAQYQYFRLRSKFRRKETTKNIIIINLSLNCLWNIDWNLSVFFFF